ncbi:MAG: hypothetical protein Q4B43_06405 [Bacteroidota bacterium]|nr:hypothetical protein [Bacteroidota bacterium]
MNRNIVLFFCLISLSIFGQTLENITTDRPDHSEGTYIIPQRNLQFENGFVLSKNGAAYEFMLRYGTFKGNEVRLESELNYTADKLNHNGLTLSSKQKILNQDNFFPSVTVVGYLEYEYATKTINPDLLLAFESEFDRLFFVTNIGTKNRIDTGIFTFQSGVVLSDKFTLYGEYFLLFSKSTAPNHGFDGGMLFLLQSHLQIDLSGGGSYIDNSFFAYVSAGVSILFR